MDREVKRFCFKADSVSEIDANGIRVGRISGYASTYGNVDRVGDVVEYGAFRNTIEKFKAANRPIRMYYQHDSNEIIGAFLPDKVREDSKGLYVEGELNLEVQRAREVYALAKQGVISDLSIGYTVNDFDVVDGIRRLKDLELWEISMVNEPANPQAKITAVKSITDLKEQIKKKSDFEKILRDAGFSRSSAKFMASLVDLKKLDEEEDMQDTTELREEVETVATESPEAVQEEKACVEIHIETAPNDEQENIETMEIDSMEDTVEGMEVEEDSDPEESVEDREMLELLSALRDLINKL